MAFKMKGEPMKRNFGVGGPAKLKKEEEVSPMKNLGIYETDYITGETRQISEDEYKAREGGPDKIYTTTGRDMGMKETAKGEIPFTKDEIAGQNRRLARGYGLTTPKGKVAQGERAQKLAAEIDARIQDKINKGLPLTDKEKAYQRKMIADIGN